ncbi:hypothetical protein OIU77_002252 [Salix suchowensis]|uniref:RNase H type-1 domain-containing protein n=1 Tax=Salix suchowensis TaxID=1278906 RepID=A0ABQ9B5W7_9ROSI|nr:hypothetical protein OIU77_002252 [Salix suchowensis]
MFGFSSRIQSRSSFEAELVAVREALKLAWDKGLRWVIVESDSETVVDRIRNQRIRQSQESDGGDHIGMSGLWLQSCMELLLPAYLQGRQLRC